MGSNVELRKVIKEEEIVKKWSASNWAKKCEAKKIRTRLTDFDRFQVMVLKRQVCAISIKSF